MNSEVEAWYFHSTWIWGIVMILGSLLYFYQINSLKKQGINIKKLFSELPSE